jgi:hypothetical protein
MNSEYEKWSRRLQILSLLSIFFIYKTIESTVNNDAIGTSFWGMMTIVYLISMTIALYVLRKYREQDKLQ